ncbi:Sialin, partial [Sarcoptes scabiei]
RFTRMISRKWIISMLGTYACAIMYAQRTGMSVAIVRMVNSTISSSNHTSVSRAPKFNWNETVQGLILGSTFFFYWIVPTLVGSVTNRFGGKRLAFVGIFFPCILTALIPTAAKTDANLFILVQSLNGLFQGFIYPSLFHLYVKWFEPDERSKANSGIQFGQSIGGALMSLIGGYLCETVTGWPLLYYFMSLVHIPWIILWVWLASDQPTLKAKINNSNSKNQSIRSKTPWLSIFTSSAVWASILSKISCSYGFYMMLSKLPAYLDSVHSIDIVQNGTINGAILMSYGISCLIAPYLSVFLLKRTNLQLWTVRKIFQGIAMLAPAICLASITFTSDNVILSITLLIVAMFGYGFFTAGEWTMISEYAPNNVGTVSGAAHILGLIMGFLAPYIVGIILDSNLGDLQFKWNLNFYITSVLYLLGYLAFLILGTVRQQQWDFDSK